MDTHALRLFLDIYRLGSYAAVARLHRMDPSRVSRAASSLEAALGVRLFQRSTRRVEPTAAAQRLAERLEPLLIELDAALTEASDSAGQVRGSLRITASVAFGVRVLSPMLSALKTKHPGLLPDLLLSDAVQDLLAERIDLAFRMGPSPDSTHQGLRLAPTRYRVLASPAWIQKHGPVRAPAQLAELQVVTFSLPGYRDRWRFRQAAGAMFEVPIRPGLLASNALVLLQSALDGLGPALLADWMTAQERASGQLVDLFPDHQATATDFDTGIWLLYPTRRHLPRRIRCFIDFARQWFAEPGRERARS